MVVDGAVEIVKPRYESSPPAMALATSGQFSAYISAHGWLYAEHCCSFRQCAHEKRTATRSVDSSILVLRDRLNAEETWYGTQSLCLGSHLL